MYLAEVKFKLGVEQADFRPLEHFGHKVAALLEHLDRDVEGCHQQLRLDVLVHVVEASDVRSPITNHQVTKLALKSVQNASQGLAFGDVPHNVVHVVDGGSFLEIDRDNPLPNTLFLLPRKQILLP